MTPNYVEQDERDRDILQMMRIMEIYLRFNYFRLSKNM